MKIALICPSNMLYMPYVDNYTKILDEINVDYSVINWDRFKIEKESEFIYRDSKIGHQRSFLDYFKYSRFVLNILKKNKYDKVIVFGIQLVFFLKRFLIKEYSNKLIIDIRDYHRIIKYFNIGEAIYNSTFTVLSSPGYIEWLPKSSKYTINHNLIISDIKSINEDESINNNNQLIISYIGTLNNLDINIEFIDKFSNDDSFLLYYIGDGLINEQLKDYVQQKSITNVIIKGRYSRDMEKTLYESTNFVNMVLYGNNINSKTCLSNRLYKGAFYGKPIIGVEGTLIADIIKEYNLGLVVKSLDTVKTDMNKYMENFSYSSFNHGRVRFLSKVIDDNRLFEKKIKKFTV